MFVTLTADGTTLTARPSLALPTERAAESVGLPENVRLQTGYSQVQVVGSAEQSGEPDPRGEPDLNVTSIPAAGILSSKLLPVLRSKRRGSLQTSTGSSSAPLISGWS